MSIQAKSKSKAKGPAEPVLCFDVQWLSGQKTNPDPLPTRQEFQQLQAAWKSPTKKIRPSVNILASLLAIGLISSVAYGLYHFGWIPPGISTRPLAIQESPLSAEEQRQANETIEAILALQEMAAQSESNSPTQKR